MMAGFCRILLPDTVVTGGFGVGDEYIANDRTFPSLVSINLKEVFLTTIEATSLSGRMGLYSLFPLSIPYAFRF